MANIGTLVARVEADVGPYKRGMATAEKRTKRFERVVKKSFKSVGSAFKRITKSVFSFKGAMVAAAGAFGLGLLVTKTLELADKIAKTSDAIGISTDALQEYRFAAGLAGVSTGQLDSAIGSFVKRMGEAKLTGKGTLTEFLKDANKELLKMLLAAESSEEALGIFLKALGEIEDQADKVALSAAAFGRTAGLGMTVLVKQGAAAIDDMRQKARDLGIVLDEDLLRAAERATDQLSILGQVLKAKVNQAILENADNIAMIASSLTDAIPKLITFVETFGIWAGILEKRPAQRIVEISDELTRLNATMLNLNAKNFTDFLLLDDRIVTTQTRIDELTKSLLRLQVASVDDAGLGIKPKVPTPAERVAATVVVTDDEKKKFDEGEFGSGAQGKLIAFFEKRNKLFEDGRRITEASITPLDAFINRTERLNELLKSGVINTGTHSRALANAADQYDNLIKKTDELGTKGVDAFSGIADSMQRAIENGEGLKGVLNSLISSLQEFIFEQLKSASIGSGGGGGGEGGNFLSTLFKIGASFLGGGGGGPTPGDIAGTPFQHGGSFEVAGRGGTDANLIKMRVSRGEQVDITPRGRSKGGKGLVGATIFIDARNADHEGIQSLKQLIAGLDATIEERAVGAVVNARRRNPSLFGSAI